MNRKIISALAFILTLAMLSLSISAQRFKDVPKSHWAYSYIEECASEGLLQGGGDNKFNPDQNIRYVDMFALISRLVNATEADIQEAQKIYGPGLEGKNIVSWVKTPILICLQKSIINQDMVYQLAKNGALKDRTTITITRTNTVALFAKALNLPESNTKLTYKDNSDIPESAIKYIAQLQDIGVLHPQGSDGKFNGSSPIKKSEVAKMLKVATDYIKKNGSNPSSNPNNVPTPSVVPSEPVNLDKSISGKVIFVGNKDGINPFFVTISESSGNQTTIKVNPTKQINLNGGPGMASGIETEMEASVVATKTTEQDGSENYYLKSGTFKTSVNVIDAEITYVSDKNFDVQFKYKDGNSEKRITLDVERAKITVNDENARIEDLRKGYTAKVTYQKNNATIVEAKKPKTDYDGFFKAFKNSSNWSSRYNTVYLEFREPDGRYSSTEVELRDEIYVNGKRYKSKDFISINPPITFIEGQPIKLEFESSRDGRRNNDIITSIEAVFPENIEEGTIVGFLYRNFDSRDNKITLTNQGKYSYNSSYSYLSSGSSKNVTYDVDRYVKYYNDDSSIDLDSNSYYGTTYFKEGEVVRLEIRNGVVTEIRRLTKYGNGYGYGYGSNLPNGTNYAVGQGYDSATRKLDLTFIKYYRIGSKFEIITNGSIILPKELKVYDARDKKEYNINYFDSTEVREELFNKTRILAIDVESNQFRPNSKITKITVLNDYATQ